MNKGAIDFLNEGLEDLVNPVALKFTKVSRRSVAGYLGLAGAYLSIGFNQVIHDEKEGSKENAKRIEAVDRNSR